MPVIGFEPVEDVADDSTYKLDGLSYEEAESLALGYMGRADKLIDKYLDKFKFLFLLYFIFNKIQFFFRSPFCSPI